MGRLVDRTKEISYNNFGSKMEIVGCRRSTDIDVYFEEYNWIAKNRDYKEFVRKTLTCPYERRTYGVGYLGEGKYKTTDNGKLSKFYNLWVNMLERCYDPYAINKHITYKDVFVEEYLLNFQNFAKWCEENYYEIEGEEMHLDKDILCRAYGLNNKIYSRETMIFVPQRINKMFTKTDKLRGEYPIGVSYHKRDKVLRVKCGIYEDGKKEIRNLGSFPINKPFQAFTCYKNFKENYIKQVADEYKDLIPTKLYNALYLYKVEIND